MKPYAGYKGNNLVNIVARAVAFVPEGANKKKFFLFKSNNNEQGVNAMEKSLAISLIKAGNLNENQVQSIVNAVDYSDRAEVLAVAKGGDPENNAMGNIMAQFMPEMIRKEMKRQFKKMGLKKGLSGASKGSMDGSSGASGSSDASGSSGASGASEKGGHLKEILNKLDDLLDNEEQKDPELQKAMKAAAEGCGVANYADLQKKWEEGTLDDSESKEYMKAKTSIRKKARAAVKADRIKAEKEAIEALSGKSQQANQEGNAGASLFDKEDAEKIKKIFAAGNNNIADPVELEKRMSILKAAVAQGIL